MRPLVVILAVVTVAFGAGSFAVAGAATKPVTGGEITIGEFSPPRGFDPIIGGMSNGSVGGVELMALYDTIVSWNPKTGEYEPRTAESLKPNDDYTVWTLRLKDGIEFTDGTPTTPRRSSSTSNATCCRSPGRRQRSRSRASSRA